MPHEIFGVSVFEGVEAWGMAGLAVVFLGSYFLKGAFGVGALTPAILFGSFLVPPHHAVLLALMANAASQIQFIPEGVRHGNWKVVKRYIPAYLVGVAIGVVVFAWLDARWLTLVLGSCLAVLMIAELLRLPERLAEFVDLQSPTVSHSLAGASGLVTGVSGAGGLFFMIALLKFSGLAPRPFRATTFLLSAFSIFWRTVLFVLGGFVTVQLLIETAFLMPVVVLGGVLGNRMFHLLPARGFFMGVQIVLLAAALGLVWSGLQ